MKKVFLGMASLLFVLCLFSVSFSIDINPQLPPKPTMMGIPCTIRLVPIKGQTVNVANKTIKVFSCDQMKAASAKIIIPQPTLSMCENEINRMNTLSINPYKVLTTGPSGEVNNVILFIPTSLLATNSNAISNGYCYEFLVVPTPARTVPGMAGTKVGTPLIHYFYPNTYERYREIQVGVY